MNDVKEKELTAFFPFSCVLDFFPLWLYLFLGELGLFVCGSLSVFAAKFEVLRLCKVHGRKRGRVCVCVCVCVRVRVYIYIYIYIYIILYMYYVYVCMYVCVCVRACVCVCVCVSVASHISETSEAIAVTFDTVTASVMKMHHVSPSLFFIA